MLPPRLDALTMAPFALRFFPAVIGLEAKLYIGSGGLTPGMTVESGAKAFGFEYKLAVEKLRWCFGVARKGERLSDALESVLGLCLRGCSLASRFLFVLSKRPWLTGTDRANRDGITVLESLLKSDRDTDGTLERPPVVFAGRREGDADHVLDKSPEVSEGLIGEVIDRKRLEQIGDETGSTSGKWDCQDERSKCFDLRSRAGAVAAMD